MAWPTSLPRPRPAEDRPRVVDDGDVAPHRWPSYFHGTHRVRLTRFPYLVVYRDDETRTLVVVAVAHEKRKPGYWRKR